MGKSWFAIWAGVVRFGMFGLVVLVGVGAGFAGVGAGFPVGLAPEEADALGSGRADGVGSAVAAADAVAGTETGAEAVTATEGGALTVNALASGDPPAPSVLLRVSE